MTQRPRLRWNRINRMVLPAAIVLAVVLAFPVIAGKIKDHQEIADVRYAEMKRAYDAQLTPCKWQALLEERLAPDAGEIGIYILPAFADAQVFKVSQRNVSHYSGDPAMLEFHRPPPSSPSAYHSAIARLASANVEFEPYPAINPSFAGRIFEFLQTEIDNANSPHRSGLDGIVYQFAHGKSCAETWSPEPETRAAKLVELVENLARLSNTPADQRSEVAIRMRNLLDELDAQKREFEP